MRATNKFLRGKLSVKRNTERKTTGSSQSSCALFLNVCLNTSFPSSYIKGRRRVYTTSDKILLAKAIVTCERNILLP